MGLSSTGFYVTDTIESLAPKRSSPCTLRLCASAFTISWQIVDVQARAACVVGACTHRCVAKELAPRSLEPELPRVGLARHQVGVVAVGHLDDLLRLCRAEGTLTVAEVALVQTSLP